MFFSASIAFTFVLSLSGIAVHSAPIVAREDFVPLACDGVNLTGNCTPLRVTVGDGLGLCTNVANVKSLKLNVDNDCVSHPLPDCTIDFANPNSFAVEHFSDDKDINNIQVEIQSISCQAIPGLVNGLFPQ
ncbi:hypothetical protein C8R43DRAFT_1036575 [Mycena crocata]|nr:hypothetical protein C8R43DRAFT_1036575 [Mycena crocata]